MADVLRSELKGSQSPGGTKTFELDVQYGQKQSSMQKRLQQDEDQYAKEDAMFDKARKNAGLDESDDGDEGAQLEEMRRRYRASQKQNDEDGDDSQYKSGSKSKKNSQQPPGDFSWDNFDQVKQLSEANASLLQQLDSKDKEIDKMKAMVAATAPIGGFDVEKLSGVIGQNGKYVDEETGFKDAKIVELAKKNRRLTVTMEKERSKVGKLAKEIERLQKELKSSKSKSKTANRMLPADIKNNRNNNKDKASSKELAAAENEIKKLRRRTDAIRISRDKAKEDVRRVINVLRKEVGDSINVDAVLQGTMSEEGWRGRSQQIVMLRTKCKRLEKEIKRLREGDFGNERRGGKGMVKNTSSSTSLRSSFDVDERATNQIKEMERNKLEAAETVARELGEMRKIAILQKEKLDGQKARLSNLTKDNKKMRGEIKVLLNKTGTDDKLIDALREEVAQSRAAVNEMSRRLESIKMHDGMNEAEWTSLKKNKKEQRQQLEQQTEMIATLRAQVEQMQNNATTDLATRAEQDLSIHNKNTDINLLKIESERVTEMAEMFKNKFENETRKNAAAASKIRELESRCVSLERRLGNIHSGGLKRQPPADQFQQLKDKLALQIEENLALKKSFRTGLATKEEELRILRTLTEQQQAAYENAMTHMRRQVKQTAGQAQAKVIQTESKNDSNIMTQLQADNDYLRKELKTVKDKLREFQMRSRIRKSEFFDEKSRSAVNELKRRGKK